MNYILRESFNGEHYLSLRPDKKGRIIVNINKNGNNDIGDKIVFLKGKNFSGVICKDVWLSSNLDNLISKGKEISKQYGLELKLSMQLKMQLGAKR